MQEPIDFGEARDLFLALLIGALIGIEREQTKRAKGTSGTSGIRTFVLVAVVGAVCALVARDLAAPLVFAGGLLAVAATVLAGYLRQAPGEHLGLTTEVAALGTYLLAGATIYGYATITVPLAIATSAILAFKEPIHGGVERLGREDLYAGLKLLIATFIVLPLLPDRTIDPLDALNPYKLWLLVILISALSLVGYVAARVLGSQRGAALTGLTGGLVSSTAVTLAFARESRGTGQAAGSADALASGILLSWAVMFARVLVTVAVVNAALVGTLALPFGVLFATTLAIGLVHYRIGRRAAAPAARAVELRNPFSLIAACKFAVVFAVVLLAVKLVQRYAPDTGTYAVAALAGLTDVDAVTLTMATGASTPEASRQAVLAIAIAAVANTLSKAGLIALLGSRELRARALVGAGIVTLAAGATLFLI